MNELDQLRVLRISHGTVVVIDWVDPIQTVRGEGGGASRTGKGQQKQTWEKIQNMYVLAVKPAFGGLHCYGAPSTAALQRRSSDCDSTTEP